MKMHLTGMENFNIQQKRSNPVGNNSNGVAITNDTFTDSRTISQKSNVLDAMKGNKKVAILGNVVPNVVTKSNTLGPQIQNQNAAYNGAKPIPADQREKKIYEIYSQGKANIGPV